MARMILNLGLALLVASILLHSADALEVQATIGQVSGGSCGYDAYPPPAQMVTGFSEAIYFGGSMCGSCFKVQCLKSPACRKGAAINVMVTSICQSTNTTDVCNTGNQALNLDPRAWDLIATTRAVGSIPVVVYSAMCTGVAPTSGVQFHVSVASAYFFQVLIQNVGGYGRLKAVYASANGVAYFPMYRNYGSVWAIQQVNFLNKPVSFKLVDMNGKVLLIPKALPATWAKGNYMTALNFKN